MTVQEYINQVPEERLPAFSQLRETILANLPSGFEECINYNMIGYVVPHTIYPDGYHCDTALPLPFANLANQKNFIGFYHMGVYAQPALLNWFQSEYKDRCKYKLDMGKSCVRFKRMNDIPFDLVGELMTKMSVEDWVTLYEENVKRK